MAGLLALVKNFLIWRATTRNLRKYESKLSYMCDPKLAYELPVSKGAKSVPKK